MKFGKRILGLSASAALMLSLSAGVPVFATTTTPTETPATATEWTGAMVYGSPTGTRYASGFPKTNAAADSSASDNVTSKLTSDSHVTDAAWTLDNFTNVPSKIENTAAGQQGDGKTSATPYSYTLTGLVDLEQGGGKTTKPWINWVDVYFTGKTGDSATTVLSPAKTTVKLNATPVTVADSMFYWIGETGSTATALGFDFDAATDIGSGKIFTVEIDPDGLETTYEPRHFKIDYSAMSTLKPNPENTETEVYVEWGTTGTTKADIVAALNSESNYKGGAVPTGLNIASDKFTTDVINRSLAAKGANATTDSVTLDPVEVTALPDNMTAAPLVLQLAAKKYNTTTDWCGQSHSLLTLPSKVTNDDKYQMVNDIKITVISDLGKIAEDGAISWADVGSRYMKETTQTGKLTADGIEYIKGNGTPVTASITAADANNPTKGYTIAVTGDVDLEAPRGDIANGWGNSLTLKVELNKANESAITYRELTNNNNGGFYFADATTGSSGSNTKALFLNMNPGRTKSYSTVVKLGKSDSDFAEIPITIDLSGVNCIQAGGGEGNISIPVGKTDAEIRAMMRDPKNYTNIPVGLDVANLTDAVIDAAASQAGAPIPTIIEEGKEYSIKLAATKPNETAKDPNEKHPVLMLPSLQNYQVVNDVTINVGLQVQPKPAEKQDPSVIVMNNINAGWKPAQAKNTILTTANNFPHNGISDFTDATVSEIYLYRGDLSAIKTVEDFRKIATTDLTVITDNDVMMENRTYVALLQVPASAIKEGYTDAIIVAFKAQKSTFDNTTGKTETVVKNTGTGSTATVAVADELVNDINGTGGKAKAGKISNDSGKDIATFTYVSAGKTVTPTQIKEVSDALSKLVVGKSTDKATDKAVEEIIKDVPGAVTYTFGSTTSISDFGFKVELRLNDLPASLGSNPTLFHMVNGKAVNMGKVNISGGSAVVTITGFSDYFLVKGVDELSAGEGATDSASDVVAETTTAAPAETVATTTVAETTAAVIETVAPVATTAAASNPKTGNAPIALAVIPVAIAAAAVVAKKIVK